MNEHYKQHSIEPIDVIDEYDLNFNLGNAIKYILRSKYKGSELQDLVKAKTYLEYEISKQEKLLVNVIEERLNDQRWIN